jgi:ATP-dependent DNA ligase
VLVGQFEFLGWTGDTHWRHSKFVGLREDKKASDVVRE